MLIIWQGRGPIALIALAIPMALVTIGLFVSLRIEDLSRRAIAAWVFTPLVVGSVLAGMVCLRYGRRLNKDRNLHSLYGIPLQHWALIYWGVAALGIVGFVIGLIHNAHAT
jgi:MFS family permease